MHGGAQETSCPIASTNYNLAIISTGIAEKDCIFMLIPICYFENNFIV
jgi:hypothetical protein